MQERHRTLTNVILLLVVLSFGLNACLPKKHAVEVNATDASSPAVTVTPTVDENGILLAETEFIVTAPEDLQDGQKMTLEILDEVTGLALNPQRYPMTGLSANKFSVKQNIRVGSVVKYRYLREGKTKAIEYSSDGRQVRYRMVYVQNPGVVEDVISAWNDHLYTKEYGRIQGRVLEKETNLPIVGSLVAAGGQQTLTASDGTFLLDSLPPGKHNLVIYSLDGSSPPFQQEAIVNAESSTPAEIRLEPARYVNITFLVKAPDDIPDGIPMHLVGNIYPLGNTFADLRGGVSTISSRAPLLNFLGDRHYRFTVRLPAGLDLRYKYSLGDGFWNAERGDDGSFSTRQLIVPETDLTVEENINSFTTPGIGPVTFSVSVSAGLSAGEILSIQFNPYGWTEPIPMWRMGDNRWVYILYTPLGRDVIGEAGYRFCKNDQCGIADDTATFGPDAPGKLFKPKAEPQLITYDVKEWYWHVESVSATTVTSEEIKAKDADFVTGVELLPDYHPSWQAYMGPAFKNINNIRSKWVVLAPTWHFTSTNPPVLSDVPGQDASWYDNSRMAVLAREMGLKIAVHPTLSYYQPSELWWMEAKRDGNWWQSWFDRYETFIINYADFASQIGAEALILGDPSLRPALPGGLLYDGTSSGVPEDASMRWINIIAKARERFSGKIIWRLDYPTDKDSIPEFIASTDEIYLVLSGKLGDFENPQKDVIRPAVSDIIENEILLLRDRLDKPFLLGIAYPSATGAASGCVLSGDSCMPSFVFEQAGLDLPAVTQNLDEQTEIYNAIFEVINQNTWIKGVIASGYYPAVAIEDKSISIRGKPASDVIWFWFDRLRGSDN